MSVPSLNKGGARGTFKGVNVVISVGKDKRFLTWGVKKCMMVVEGTTYCLGVWTLVLKGQVATQKRLEC